MSKPSCIFISHRIPFPPDTGEKLRSYHILQGLMARYEVTIVAGIDRAEDWPHRHAFPNNKCHWIDLRDRSDVKCGLKAIASGSSITEQYFITSAIKKELTAKQQVFDLAYIYSSGAAPLLRYLKDRTKKTVIDFVDVDSAKWDALATEASFPMSWVYKREGKKLASYEKILAKDNAVNLFVTEQEANLFKQRSSLKSGVYTSENGVNCEYWKESYGLADPYKTDSFKIIFTGAMDYPPNIQAVSWFCNNVMPQIRSSFKAEFFIVGGRPTSAVSALANDTDVHVTGRVEDMRPWLYHADVAVAPLQIARGIQNKILEAMATGTPMIATANAINGIDAQQDHHYLMANTPVQYVQLAQKLRNNKAFSRKIAMAAQHHMMDRYDWNARVKELFVLIDEKMNA